MLRRSAVLSTLVAAFLSFGFASSALAGDFTPASGTYTVDTTALKLTGPGPTEILGVDQGGIAVFSFENVNVPSGVTIVAMGSRPLKIVASGTLTMAGTINADGQSSVDSGGGGVRPGGPGGGAGGAGNSIGTVWSAGSGQGGGGAAASQYDGGGGGGFGGKGARGGIQYGGGAGGPGGPAYGNLNVALEGGSGGSGSAFAEGGGGGGAVALFAHTLVSPATGTVSANGGGGALGAGASGGGSGGGIVIHGDSVEVDGVLTAKGGDGGLGGCCGAGGGGGGGRIAYQYRALVASGTARVDGGISGVRSTSGCCTGTTGASPDPAGAPGVVTRAQAATATTGPATAVSSSGATLNGTVNPNEHQTSYYFEYGTTGAYGSPVPATPAAVGSDASDHVVSQTLGGLAPYTTYHYRLVAVDALGFTTYGTDIGFTTSAAPPPPESGSVPAPGAGSAPGPKRCKKGFVRRHGKCVRKHHRRRHHRRKHRH
jgi:hypothetical protein